MDDTEILHHIQKLVDEEHELMGLKAQGKLEGDEHARIQALEVALDQCWDLLRQRRARRSAGLNPEDAHVRPPDIVEHYKQ
ncbi:MAG: DUF2630 family protein [Chloroflexi bacterium]|nr:DUF2630 family protein [Ktedonobacteraceae bacterium]MBV8822579.1 DUF2630 family protein [Ktedonobacteraceae bacterium]MBV9021136.1 DUF2630 family protein [Ktedonobacteraceae bacterium]MBV9705902.1 DUF2630 family protein [Chloroflexota bacterium]